MMQLCRLGSEQVGSITNLKEQPVGSAVENFQKIYGTDQTSTSIPSLITIKNSDFYSNFQSELDQLKASFEANVKDYCSFLKILTDQLQQRKSDIFNQATFNEPQNLTRALNSIRDQYEDLCNKSNHFRKLLSAEQIEARASLRLYEVHTFIVDIKYSDECEGVEKLKTKFKKAEKSKKTVRDLVDKKKQKIAALKAMPFP